MEQEINGEGSFANLLPGLKERAGFFREYQLYFYLDYLWSRIWALFNGSKLNDNPIVVLGMHRSGTSLAAGILNIAGMFIGRPKSIVGKTIDNPKGHFENRKILTINKLIFRHYNTDWKSLKSLPPDWHSSKFTKNLSAKAKTVLNREFFGQQKWGFKDPRCCITFKFWKQLFPKMKLVVTERDEREIIDSLDKRKDKPENSKELLRHYLDSLKEDIKNERYKIISFSKMIEKDRQEITSLLKYVNLSVDRIEEINNFISSILYRSRVNIE